MADIRGFKSLHYNPLKVNNLTEVVTPPYDVITPEQRIEYAQQSKYNLVRLTLPEGEDAYQAAAETMKSWIEQEIFDSDQDPSIYIYHQTFRTPDGEQRTRKGFFCIVRVENFDKGHILPHEKTLFAPKEDRLKLLRACKANLEPIFGLYSDPEQQIDSLLEPLTTAPPRAKVTDSAGITHSVWAIKEQNVVQQVQTLMQERWVLIADGHHRYESCIVYRDEMSAQNPDSEAPFHFTLFFLTNMNHPGITILPYNRGVSHLPKFEAETILKKAGRYFEIREFEDQQSAQFALKREGEETTAILALFQGSRSYYLFRLKPHVKIESFYPEGTPEVIRKLDVNILHRIFLHDILGISDEDVEQQKYLKYYKDSKEERKDFEAGRLQVAFFLNPTRVDQVVTVSRSGETMPQKSTFFYPKVMSGFVIYSHL